MSKYLDSEGVKILWELWKDRAPKRDNHYNYKSDFIPYAGQICFVDTPFNGLQVKVGDGETVWEDLPFFIGDSNRAGLTKLYNELGANEDGALTQKKITEELSTRYKASVNAEEELLVFSL